MPDAICFDYQDGDTRYELTLTRQRTLVDYTWIDFAKGWQKTMLKLIRYPGGYMRFAAATNLNCYQEGKLVEHYEKHRCVRADFLRAVRSTKNRWSTTWPARSATIAGPENHQGRAEVARAMKVPAPAGPVGSSITRRAIRGRRRLGVASAGLGA